RRSGGHGGGHGGCQGGNAQEHQHGGQGQEQPEPRKDGATASGEKTIPTSIPPTARKDS
ncbi:MAG: hypothetical protein GXP05_02230, partial [Alphaproteobacteria bacterium]|nr:hypothetical protein [Alphaproteobacteria bacterium]